MKKYIFLILVLILFPINVFANEIKNIEIAGTTEKNIGDEVILDFRINFNDFKLNEIKTTGIWKIKFELIYDDNILTISNINSEDFSSYVYKENNKYYVISDVIENQKGENICKNNILYCGDYETSITFFIKKTELQETTIKMNAVEVDMLDIVDETKTYTFDDINKITNDTEKSHTIKISKLESEIYEEPQSIVSDIIPIIKDEKKIINNETNNGSAFIKELKIKGYNIDFDKNKTNYNISVDKNTNSLSIDVKLENEKATYKIIGADDLKGNNNEIAIIVTSENNNIITYTINVKNEENPVVENNKQKIDISSLIDKYLTKDNLMTIAIVIGIIIIIILLILLKNKRENKKINNLLKEL